jgi:choline dehydrogenase-like flavoprotein
VAVFEAGGLEITQQTQGLYEGKIVGFPYFPLDGARLRYFGGTSNHWAGYTRPLDPRDFETLDYHRLNEWPIKKKDLDPYIKDTEAILESSFAKKMVSVEWIGTEDGLLPPTPYRVRPVRFGEKYLSEVKTSELIYVYLHANLVDINLSADYKAVTGMLFRSYGRHDPFLVQGRYFILCLGGLENPRALLNAHNQLPKGIGNDTDQVGRYFCDHLSGSLGSALLEAPLRSTHFYLAASQHLNARKCLPFQLEVKPIRHRASDLCYDEAPSPTPLAQRLRRALLGDGEFCFDAKVEFYSQQANNPDSRVILSAEKDRFGLRQLALDWRLSELDYHTIKIAALMYGRHIAETSAGRMHLEPWLRSSRITTTPPPPIRGSYHHMCTTRMSDDPRKGVVDRNCRVHGIENLFLGGSSVFSSAGISNPTYTIAQLALRLGDYINSQLR